MTRSPVGTWRRVWCYRQFVPKVPPQHWLIKSEPRIFCWAQLARDGKTRWDGVRNCEARNNLRAMRSGDLCLFCHSNAGEEVVGIAKVVKEAYADRTAPGEEWSVVEVAPHKAIRAPVSLDTIKRDPDLAEMALLKRSRISVLPVTTNQFEHILKLGKTKL